MHQMVNIRLPRSGAQAPGRLILISLVSPYTHLISAVIRYQFDDILQRSLPHPLM